MSANKTGATGAFLTLIMYISVLLGKIYCLAELFSPLERESGGFEHHKTGNLDKIFSNKCLISSVPELPTNYCTDPTFWSCSLLSDDLGR